MPFFDAILSNEISLAVTTEIINEYEEILNQFFESEDIGGNVVMLILNLPNTIRKDIYYNWLLIEKDPDDNKYVDCAVASNADFIITDDAHFKILKQVAFPKVVCLRLEEFREVFVKK
jgi:putative PIN family toxin of toxin-antitoxin system